MFPEHKSARITQSDFFKFLKVLSNYSSCSWRDSKNKMALVFCVKAFYWAVQL